MEKSETGLAGRLECVRATVSESGAATIELNRPQRLNAWNPQMARELMQAIEAAGEDETVRSVVLTGAGRAFSAGADLSDGGAGEIGPDGRPDLYGRLTGDYNPLILAVRRIGKPVIAAVDGAAAGIGCSLALACDLVIASSRAYFLLAFANIGLVPDGGCSMLLPRRIGAARATELAMLGERLPAAIALEWGLINRVVENERLREEATALAERLAAGPTRAYAGIKRQLNGSLYAGLEEQLELEAQIQQEMARTEDFLEGVGAFIEKRPAHFTGR